MKQEPVAWMNPEDGNCVSDAYKQRYPFDDKDKLTTPLYTAPRELSDEEIIHIWGTHSIWDDKLIKFARAILKKASEK